MLVTVCDESWFPMAQQMFFSAIEAGQWHHDLALITTPEANENGLNEFRQKNVIIKVYPIFPLFAKGYLQNNITYHKLHLFKNEFKYWDSITYVDCDVIVKYPLVDLIKMQGFVACTCQAAPRMRTCFAKSNRQLSDLVKEYRINLADPCFNAGVFSFSTDLIQDKTFSQLVYLCNKYHQLFALEDQSCLNAYFYKKWTPLPMRYNMRIMPEDTQKIDSGILHFYANKETKPWNPVNIYHDDWKKNLSRFRELPPRQAVQVPLPNQQVPA